MSEAHEAAPADIAAPIVDAALADVNAHADTQGAEDPADLLASVASEMGWSPKEKWKGDPDKWRDAASFLKNTPSVLKNTREQAERASRVASEAIQRQRTRAIEEAEARIAEAAANGDRDGASEAARELREISRGPDPLVEAFAAENSWYGTHRMATNLAIEAAQEVVDTGGSVAEQIAAGEREVKKRFPELFDDATPDDKPGKGAPVVQGGQRTANPAPRKKGWADLPASVRQTMNPKMLKTFGMNEAEYAESYWQENS